MNEQWKEVPGYENYEVSNFGNIRKKLKPNINKEGYASIGLTDEEGKRKDFRIHRLVAELFIDKIDGKFLVNHKDGVKDNNNVLNLEWCTPRENTLHAIENGMFKTPVRNFSKEEKEEMLKMLQNGERIKDVSEKFNKLTTSAIHYIMENEFGILDLSKLITQARHRHSLEERKRLKRIILESGKSNCDLSREIGLSKQLISKIKRNIEWKDIILNCKIENNFAPTTGKTNEELIKIKKYIFSSNEKAQDLAKRFNLTSKTIRNIKSGKTWKLVPIY